MSTAESRMLITVAEAAAILGLKSRGSIYRKVKSQELATKPGPDGNPRIEREGLEERWQQITREQKNSPRPQPQPRPQIEAQLLRPAAERTQPRPAPSPPPRQRRAAELDELPDFNEERARHEREKRLLAELTRQEKEGELLRRDDVTQAWGQAVNLTRVKLLGVPSTVKQRIPHLEVDEIEVITGLIREALDELSSGDVTA